MNTGKQPDAREQPETSEQPETGEQPEARIFRTERGIPAAEIGGMTIHSLRNPRREAEKLMNGMVDPAAPGLLVFGMGLVYHLDALKRLFPQKECVCFEPNSNWPARLAECGLMEPARQIITPETPDWQELLKDFFQNSYQLVALSSYRRAYPQLFDEVQTLQKAYGSRKNMNRNTLKRFGSRWVENLLSNFIFLEEQRSINEMRGMFSGFPALLLAGGPTLEAVLPLLPELRVRMIILAVDTALPRCRESGVEPDFLMVVDPQYWNTKHFERIFQELPPPPSRSILISESSAHPRTFRLNNTVPYFCGSPFPLGALFEQALPPRDRLGSGGSVSTTAWDFLKYIGASTIYIAGMDMGFPGQRTHFHGSYFEEMIAMSGTALCPAETAAVNYLYSGNPEYRKAFSGETLLSDSRMDLFCQWFEKRLKDESLKDERLNKEIDKTDSARTFALSSKSRRIPGMLQTTAEKLLSLPDIRMKITSLMRKLKDSHQKNGQQEIFIATFRALENSMREMSEHCQTALNVLTAYREDAPHPAGRDEHPAAGKADHQHVLDRLNEIDKHLLSDKNRNLAGFLIQDIMNTLAALPAPENLDEALERSRKLYAELKESMETHLRIFRKIDARIKKSGRLTDNVSRNKTSY